MLPSAAAIKTHSIAVVHYAVPIALPCRLPEIFRGLFIFALYPLLLGSNTYVFHKVGVNFAFIMNFSPKESVRKVSHTLCPCATPESTATDIAWIAA